MAVRVIVPDVHGDKADGPACKAMMNDIARLDPDEIVLLGDLVDANATFNSHQRSYTDELEESYDLDVKCANAFLDELQRVAPRAKMYGLEGNHDAHVERWAARIMINKRDADMLVEKMGPETVLDLKRRGIKYFREKQTHMGLSVPGAIRLGRCFFTHGISHSKHAADAHLDLFGASVVFGHVHRSMGVIRKNAVTGAFGAWCPGSLSQLQPLYRHTCPTTWTHGYGLQFVNKSGLFQHINVSIVKGKSLLAESGLLEKA